MNSKPTLEDIIGIEYSKLGFFREAQERIAQLRASTDALMQKQQQIQAILDAITDIMLVIDLDYKIISVNNLYFNAFEGTSPEGKYCYEVIRKRKEPCPKCPASKAMVTNEVHRQEDIIDTLKGSRYFEITASPIKDISGKPHRLLLIKRDVTAEREYQRKLYEAEKMATIGLLASGIAHEINNPLTAIYGFSQGLKRKFNKCKIEFPEDCLEDLEFTLNIILDECKRCQDIIQSLLTYSRESPTTFTTVNLNSVIKNSLKIIGYRLNSDKKDRLILDLDSNLETIEGNPQQLTQLILNLVINAIDATSTKGNIKIVTRSLDQGKIKLVVQDTGCGIPQEYLSKIFDPFFTTKPVGSGTGMGLTICYNIAQQHGANIEVESTEGKGSKFTIIFFKTNRNTPCKIKSEFL